MTSRGIPWSKYDHATANAAALSYLAVQQQDAVGLAIFDSDLKKYFKPSNSPGQWKIITNELVDHSEAEKNQHRAGCWTSLRRN